MQRRFGRASNGYCTVMDKIRNTAQPYSFIYPHLITQKSRWDLLAGSHGSWGAQESSFTLNNNLPKALSFPTCRNLSRKGRRPAWTKKTLLIQLNQKNEEQRGWRQGQATHKEYRDMAWVCKDKGRKAATLSIFERPQWLEETPGDCKKAMPYHHQEEQEDSGKIQSAQPQSPGRLWNKSFQKPFPGTWWTRR